MHSLTDSIPGHDAASLIRTAHRMADAARDAILPHFRSDSLFADNKRPADFDPVTEADRAAERAMRAILVEDRPQDGILGEEYGSRQGVSGLTWILDPIDGTRAFISGATSWGVLIGLSDGQGIRYGLIDQPYTRERFEGGLGQARLAGPMGERRLAVRHGVDLDQATLLTTFPEIGTQAEGDAFRRVAARVRLTRYGLDCYAYALLALGQIDLVIEAGLQSYDIAGPLAVVQAAGGIVTDWRGGPAHEGGQVIAAASPELHRAALELLRG
ncbi:inositol monophosphatase family protein [Paracoccus sp. 1_MG-2023]|uniref:inositol monophosphatase family protein n=1 Tax=unclassified Paracoccus (in: a-proteobacteria) TaxID=2688777 RepID=UPI001C0A3E6D|nr:MULTISPECIES: inositol monophosphatase family protein [unclassified Paracoccus (in: a-proteobacteria)]MBU2958573.1 inositol monophosphatase family protein [Paracoccus sp. C2R09]MDO6667566.1 inositol monophosphatase family protein [Paracoccus sp. 1_MG-2023]